MQKTKKATKSEFPRIKIVALFSIALLMILLLTQTVFAFSISGYFSNYATTQGPTFIDFFVFAIIFFTLCWISFSSVFKEAKNANVALSLALGFALAIALVYGGGITLKRLLPFASLILFLLVFVGIYAVLKKFIFTKDTIMSKILSFVVAVIVALALLAVAWNMICFGNNCDQNFFLKTTFGAGSMFGKLFGGIGNVFDGWSVTPPTPSATTAVRPNVLCGNEKVDSGEICDYKNNDIGDTVGRCTKTQLCDNCNRCVEESAFDAAVTSASGWMGDNWVMVLAVLAVALALGLGAWKRKPIWRNIKEKGPWNKKKKHLEALAKLLTEAQENEDRMLQNFRDLCNTIRNERTTFEESRHIVDKITTDIKETIGGEIEFINHTQVGPTGNISQLIDRLTTFNDVTEKNIINRILHEIDEQKNKMNLIPPELQREIDALENLDEHFKEHSEILETFKQHDFKEKNIITNLVDRLDENRANFVEMSDNCSNMVTRLNEMHADAHNIVATDKVEYQTMLKHIRGMRDNAIKLNTLFSQKINLLHHLVTRLKELQEFVKTLHKEELGNVSMFLDQAEDRKNIEHYDSAIYLASHALETADELLKVAVEETVPEPEEGAVREQTTKEKLEEEIERAKKIIKECLEDDKVYKSMIPKIQEELNRYQFDKVIELAENVGRIQLIGDKYNREFQPWLNDFELKMEKLKTLCNKLKHYVYTVRTSLYNTLGLTPPP
jgi:hypothetical protein